jgi:hypothetical protein
VTATLPLPLVWPDRKNGKLPGETRLAWIPASRYCSPLDLFARTVRTKVCMGAWTTLLRWTCIGLVSLPLSPCALLPAVCVLHDGNANPAPAQAAIAPSEHSCCSKSPESTNHSSPTKPASRCPHGCCRLTPVGPTVEKVTVAGVPTVTAFVSCPLALATAAVLPPAQEPQLPAQTLQNLSCLWRC